MADNIKGIGVLRYPANVNGAHKLARDIAALIVPGSIICLPDSKDENGNYRWDFRMLEGDADQVAIQRSDADEPIVIIKG